MKGSSAELYVRGLASRYSVHHPAELPIRPTIQAVLSAVAFASFSSDILSVCPLLCLESLVDSAASCKGASYRSAQL